MNGGTCIDDMHIAMQASNTGLSSKMKVVVSNDYVKSLTSSVNGAADDGILSSNELLQDAQGAALLKAMQAQIAAELGIAASLVVVNGLHLDKSQVSGRRLQSNAQTTNDATFSTTLAKVGANVYICACSAGYTGYNCEKNIDECASSPCLHGGTCQQGINTYTCVCSAGYFDSPLGTCHTELDECAFDPCQHAGTC